MKRLKGLKSSKHSFQDVVRAISELHSTLDQWYLSLVPSIKMDPNSSTLPPDVHPSKVLCLLYSYHGSLIAIHSVLVHPWNAVPLQFGTHEKEEVRKHILNSTEVVVEAARNMVRNLRHLSITPSSPKR